MFVSAVGRVGPMRHHPAHVRRDQHQAHHDQHRGEGSQEHVAFLREQRQQQTKCTFRKQGELSSFRISSSRNN